MMTVRSEPVIRTRQNPLNNQNTDASKTGFSTFGRTPRFGENETTNTSTNNSASNNTSLRRTERDLGPVREGVNYVTSLENMNRGEHSMY